MAGASTCRSNPRVCLTYRSSNFFARFRGLVAFLGLLPAPGGTEGHGGASAARLEHHRSTSGPSPGRRGSFVSHDERHGGPDHMTIAKGDPADPSRAASAPTRRSHVPNDGTSDAAAVERARKAMLHEGRDLKR